MQEVMLSNDAASRRPTICRVGTVGFAALWTDRGDGQIFGHRLSGDGRPIGDGFTVTPAGNQPVSTVAGDAERPGFAVAWMVGPTVTVRLFDSEGQGQTPVRVNEADADASTTPAIVQQEDGSHRLIVAWLRADGGIAARRLSPTGQPLGAEITVAGPDSNPQPPIQLVAVDTGHVVILWPGGLDPDTGTISAAQRTFTPDGRPLGPAESALLFSHAGDLAACAIHSPLVSGDPADFMIVHQAFGASDASGPIAPERVIIATGRRVGLVGGGPTFSLTRAAERAVATRPALAPLSGRRFIAAWAARSVANDGDTVRAAVCVSASHPPRPVSFPVSESTVGNQNHPMVATGTFHGSERMAFVWVDDGAVKARVMDA